MSEPCILLCHAGVPAACLGRHVHPDKPCISSWHLVDGRRPQPVCRGHIQGSEFPRKLQALQLAGQTGVQSSPQLTIARGCQRAQGLCLHAHRRATHQVLHHQAMHMYCSPSSIDSLLAVPKSLAGCPAGQLTAQVPRHGHVFTSHTLLEHSAWDKLSLVLLFRGAAPPRAREQGPV